MKKIKSIFKAVLLMSLMAFSSCKELYPELGDGLYAEMKTTKGTMVLKLEFEKTPLTVANFISLAEGTNTLVDSAYAGKKYYNGLKFHRVINEFMVQGGCPLGTGTGSPGYSFKDEITELRHDKPGTLSMANSGPGTNGSQFFITEKETPWLDGKHTVFGHIVVGEDILMTISDVETTKPGDKPKTDIILNEVNIIRKGKEAKDFDAAKLFNNHLEAEKKAAEEKRARLQIVNEENQAMMKSYEDQAITLESGLKIHYLKKGNGPKPVEGDVVTIFYEGYFTNGGLFDSNVKEVTQKFDQFNQVRDDQGGYNPMPMPISSEAQMIEGFKQAVAELKVGDKAFAYLPSKLAYGERGAGGVIPPNTDLIFVIELVGIQAQPQAQE
jgi:peptidyl-prolyl cis-trans isomerase A (cyclophilin A)